MAQKLKETQNNLGKRSREGKYLLQEGKKFSPSFSILICFMDQIFSFSKIIILYALFLEQKFVESVSLSKVLSDQEKVSPIILKVSGYALNPTKVSPRWKFIWNSSSGWLIGIFHFGTEQGTIQYYTCHAMRNYMSEECVVRARG